MNLFKGKQNRTGYISHALINKQKGKYPEPVISIRQLEEKDIDEVRQLLYGHFNSLTLPAVIYWSIQHIYDLLVIIVINCIFFLDLKQIFYFIIIFIIYLYIRAKLELLNHIRKECPDLKNLYESYINVEGCNFWVAEVYDNNFSSASRTTCSDIHERDKILLDQDEQGKLLNNNKSNLDDNDSGVENDEKKDLSNKNAISDETEIDKELDVISNDDLNKKVKNDHNNNGADSNDQQNNMIMIKKNADKYVCNSLINDNGNDDSDNNINNNNAKINNNSNAKIINNSNNNNNSTENDKVNSDTNKNTANTVNYQLNNNQLNFDSPCIKVNDNNVINNQGDEKNKAPNCKNVDNIYNENSYQTIYNNFQNTNNDHTQIKDGMKDDAKDKHNIISNKKKEETKFQKSDDNDCNNYNTNNDDNNKNVNNYKNGHNINKTYAYINKTNEKNDKKVPDISIFKNKISYKDKNDMLCDISDISKKQLLENKKNIQYGLNEIKKKFLNGKTNEEEDYNIRYLNKKIIGCVGIVPYKGDSSIAQLVRMVVKKDNRRMRIGSRLLTQLENFSHEQNYQELKVFTNNLNTDSLYFVKHNGFNLSQIVRRGLMRGDLLIWSKILNKDEFYKFNPTVEDILKEQ